MPHYEWACPNCGKECAAIMSYEEYDAIEELQCAECKGPLTKDNRIIGRGLKTTVRGVRKGQYNSYS